MSKSSYKRISGKPHDVQWRLYEKKLDMRFKEMGQMGKTIYESGIQKKLWRRKER